MLRNRLERQAKTAARKAAAAEKKRINQEIREAKAAAKQLQIELKASLKAQKTPRPSPQKKQRPQLVVQPSDDVMTTASQIGLRGRKINLPARFANYDLD